MGDNIGVSWSELILFCLVFWVILGPDYLGAFLPPSSIFAFYFTVSFASSPSILSSFFLCPWLYWTPLCHRDHFNQFLDLYFLFPLKIRSVTLSLLFFCSHVQVIEGNNCFKFMSLCVGGSLLFSYLRIFCFPSLNLMPNLSVYISKRLWS